MQACDSSKVYRERTEVTKAGFKFQFRKEVIKQSLCDMMLKWNEVAMLKEAIKQDYFFELFFDDLPVWG